MLVRKKKIQTRSVSSVPRNLENLIPPEPGSATIGKKTCVQTVAPHAEFWRKKTDGNRVIARFQKWKPQFETSTQNILAFQNCRVVSTDTIKISEIRMQICRRIPSTQKAPKGPTTERKIIAERNVLSQICSVPEKIDLRFSKAVLRYRQCRVGTGGSKFLDVVCIIKIIGSHRDEMILPRR